MKKLWQKNNHQQDDLIENFLTKKDLDLDTYLVESEVYGSIAQAIMLGDMEMISKKECNDLINGLHEIYSEYKSGKFVMEFGDEDIHTKVENYLTQEIGDTGKKIHTGRSRNDQILLDLRLFMKKEFLEIWKETISLIEVLAAQAKKYEFIPMPGFTHMQKAMPSSVGMWFGSYVEALLDHCLLFDAVYKQLDQSPLGAGAGYGVSLPLNRQKTSDLLGFAKVQNNSLYSQNSRGKIEGSVMFVCMQVISEVSKLSSDLLLFTISDYGYFKVDDEFTTGSSIMPQKRNIDVAEVLRAKVHVMLGQFMQVYGIVLNTPSGYNRDFQETKKAFMESLFETKEALLIAQKLFASVEPNKEKLAGSMTKELFATDAAFSLVQEGVSFRDAYEQVGNNLKELTDKNAKHVIKTTTHIGSTGNLGLAISEGLVKIEKEKVKTKIAEFNETKIKLLNYIYE